MPLAQAVEILKRQCAVIKNIQMKYSEQVSAEWNNFRISCRRSRIYVHHNLHLQFPLDMDVVIDMTEDGVRLLFDPKNQRLKVSPSALFSEALLDS